MARIAKSLRGETVNFDLFDIKNQILQAPKNDSMKAREKFINKKKRKTTRSKVNEMLADKKAAEISAAEISTTDLLVTPEPVEETSLPSASVEVAQAISERQTRKIIKRPKE